MHDIDALGLDHITNEAGVSPQLERVAAVGGHRHPFAAEGAQRADQRAAVADDDGAGLHQRLRDVDSGIAGRIVAQGRHRL